MRYIKALNSYDELWPCFVTASEEPDADRQMMECIERLLARYSRVMDLDLDIEELSLDTHINEAYNTGHQNIAKFLCGVHEPFAYEVQDVCSKVLGAQVSDNTEF
jgi:hypothetical protein